MIRNKSPLPKNESGLPAYRQTTGTPQLYGMRRERLPLYGMSSVEGIFGATESQTRDALMAADRASREARHAIMARETEGLMADRIAGYKDRLNVLNIQLAQVWKHYSAEAPKLWSSFDNIYNEATSIARNCGILERDLQRDYELVTGKSTLREQAEQVRQEYWPGEAVIPEAERKAAEAGLLPFTAQKARQTVEELGVSAFWDKYRWLVYVGGGLLALSILSPYLRLLPARRK